MDIMSPEEIFNNTGLDEPTYLELIEWFRDRPLCVNEPDKFLRFLRRKCRELSNQYYSYLRVEHTDFDPMVTRYLERQLKNQNNLGTENTGGVTTTTRTDSEGNNSLVRKGKDTEKDDSLNKLNRDITVNNDTKETLSNQRTDNLKESVANKNINDTITTTDTRTNVIEERNTKTVTEGKSDEGISDKTNNKQLNSTLPQSTTYGGGGFPGELDWKFSGTQQESNNDNTRERELSTNDTTRNTGDIDTTSTNKGNGTSKESTEGTNTKENTGNQTTTGNNTLFGVEKTSGNDTTTYSANKEIDRSLTDENKLKGTINTTTTVRNTGGLSTSNSGETTERYSGREGSPQFLLNEARNYILSTNAFQWLVSKISVVFWGEF